MSATLTVLPHPDLCPTGARLPIVAGKTICDTLLANHIEIEHACEKVTACATCHVYIRQGAHTLNEASDDEEDQLDDAWGLEPSSRLSCCVKLGTADVTIEIPMHTRNLARE
ncbi:ISC system 2Fe-2S type ferredoxin [Viridibacterium curvum]|uniref:2Fe-2S ferredoxin n=1 Tax=Viridibacterium curvum TaxID=1101404 RepID=A0ABP9R613_9RHOO